MPSLYKYLPHEYAENMLIHNSIRIGTLFSYRNTEELGNEIGDLHEGTSIEYSHNKTLRNGTELNSFESKAIKAGKGMLLQGIYIQKKHNSTNAYIYCLSKEYSKEIMERLNEENKGPKYDTCIEIFDPQNFRKAIALSFACKGRYLGLFECNYNERKHDYRIQSPHPAVLKDPEHAYQKEVRMIWTPINNDINAEIIVVNNLNKYCKMIT